MSEVTRILCIFVLSIMCVGCNKNQEINTAETEMDDMNSEFNYEQTQRVIEKAFEEAEIEYEKIRIEGILSIFGQVGITEVESADVIQQERFPVALKIVCEDSREYEVGLKKNLSVEAVKDLQTSEYIYAVSR